MWINAMLTTWLYGSFFSVALIVFSLWKWYRPEPDRVDEHDGA